MSETKPTFCLGCDNKSVEFAHPERAKKMACTGMMIGLCVDCNSRIRKIMEELGVSGREEAIGLFSDERLSVNPNYILLTPQEQADARKEHQWALIQL